MLVADAVEVVELVDVSLLDADAVSVELDVGVLEVVGVSLLVLVVELLEGSTDSRAGMNTALL